MQSLELKYTQDFLSDYLKKIHLFLFALLPLFIITGPALADISISLIGLIFLYLSIKEKKFHYYNLFFYLFIIWCIYLIYLSLYSKNVFLSLSSSLFYFRFGFFVMGSWFVLDHHNQALRYFSLCLIIIFLLSLLDGYLQYFLGQSIFGYQYDEGRILILAGAEPVLGSFLSRLSSMFFVLGIYFFQKNKISLIFLCAIIILADLLIYISGERTAFFYLMLSVVLLVLTIRKFIFIRTFSFLISLVLIFLITSFNVTIKNRMIDQTLADFNIIQKNQNNNDDDNVNSKDTIELPPDKIVTSDTPETIISNEEVKVLDKVENISDLSRNTQDQPDPESIEETISTTSSYSKIYIFSEVHESLFQSAIKIYIDEGNYFFGVGPKMYRHLCAPYFRLGEMGCSTHPHNTYIQLLLETGIAGIIPVLLLGLFIAYKVIRQIYFSITDRSSSFNFIEVGMYIAVVISLWPLAPTGSFFNNWLSVIYYLPLGFIFHFAYKEIKTL